MYASDVQYGTLDLEICRPKPAQLGNVVLHMFTLAAEMRKPYWPPSAASCSRCGICRSLAFARLAKFHQVLVTADSPICCQDFPSVSAPRLGHSNCLLRPFKAFCLKMVSSTCGPLAEMTYTCSLQGLQSYQLDHVHQSPHCKAEDGLQHVF